MNAMWNRSYLEKQKPNALNAEIAEAQRTQREEKSLLCPIFSAISASLRPLR
jgi:hypothetical protein